MFISEKMTQVLSEQYNKELYAAYLYQAMRIWAADEGWAGLEQWLVHQVEEELEHAEKINSYILHRGGKTELKAVEMPQGNWQSPYEVMKAALEHEQLVTDSIYNCVDAAKEERDYATEHFLAWFVAEQAEEEDSTAIWVDLLEKAGENMAAIMAIVGRMGARQG